MTTLAEAFDAARAQDRSALIAYLPAGFPNQQGCIDALVAMVAEGVDIVEVGLPYSDPLMDGPVIQAAVEQSLTGGTRIAQVLETVAAVAATGAAVVVMSYWNPIEAYGVQRFATALAAAGGCGVITPDLTPEEADSWIRATDEAGITRVFLAAPSSTDARLGVVAGVTNGFVYAASTMGVTGARTSVSGAAGTLVARVRATGTALPVAVGLGVSTGAQAAEVAGYADGVIVGSAFVRALADAPTPDAAIEAVRVLTRDLAAGVRAGLAPTAGTSGTLAAR